MNTQSDAPVTATPETSGSIDGARSDPPASYALPGERAFPESIALDPERGSFYVGSTENGTLYVGLLSEPMMHELVPGATGASSNGLRLLPDGNVLVAEGSMGSVSIRTPGGRLVRRIATPPAERTFINDSVVVSPTEAFVTDSFRPVLFRIDPSRHGVMEPWLDLTATPIVHGAEFNLNGIVATEDRRHLVAAQTNAAKLWRIDRTSKAVVEVTVPDDRGGVDGMRLIGRTLFAVCDGGVSIYRLAADASAAEPIGRIDDDRFRGPTALEVDGTDLLVVNAQFSALDGTPDLPFTITRVAIPAGALPCAPVRAS